MGLLWSLLDSSMGEYLTITCGIIGWLVVMAALRDHRWAMWILIFPLVGWAYVFVFKNVGPNQYHLGLPTLLILVSLWIRAPQRAAPDDRQATSLGMPALAENIVFGTLLIGGCIVPTRIGQEYLFNVSGAYEASLAIRRLDPRYPHCDLVFGGGRRHPRSIERPAVLVPGNDAAADGPLADA
jgi:hypothetical protein